MEEKWILAYLLFPNSYTYINKYYFQKPLYAYCWIYIYDYFVTRNFRGTCSFVEMLKGYMLIFQNAERVHGQRKIENLWSIRRGKFKVNESRENIFIYCLFPATVYGKKSFLSKESDTKILQCIYFAYKVGIISSYSKIFIHISVNIIFKNHYMLSVKFGSLSKQTSS